MSRTLKRPMFRDGGRANSKGTGIMTGIEDREGFSAGTLVGGDKGFGRVRVEPNPDANFNLLDYFLPNATAQGSGQGGQSKRFPEILIPETTAIPGGQQIVSGAIGEDAFTEGSMSDFVDNLQKVEGEEDKEITKPNTAPPGRETKSREKIGEELDDLIKQKQSDENTITNLDFFEKGLEEEIEMYKNLLGKSKKDRVLDALLAASPGLLRGDYAEAVEDAGEAIKDDTKAAAAQLAIKRRLGLEEIEKKEFYKALYKQDEGSNSKKEYDELTRLHPNMSEERKLDIAYGSVYDKRPSIQDVRLKASNFYKENGTSFEKDNINGFIQAEVEVVEYGIPVLPYELTETTRMPGEKFKKDGQEVINKYELQLPKKGGVYFDPKGTGSYLASDPEGKFKRFQNRDEAIRYNKGE